jgi:hypothetical protein
MTVPARRLELALISSSRYGWNERTEVSTQALMFLLLPQAALKFRFWESESLAAAVRGRLSYPTLFLNVVSKEGAFGLLPATSDPPHAVLVEGDALGSWTWHASHAASLWLGVAVAPRESSRDFPVLDFPFLYPRFAALYTTAVPRAGLGGNGHIVAGLFYLAELVAYVLSVPDVEGGFALEPSASLEYRFSKRAALEFGLRTSYAQYPIGTRTHFLPYADLRIGF